MGSKRQSWSNPLGKVISLSALGLAALFGVFGIISGSGIVAWSTGDEQATMRLWGSVVLGVICVACMGFALLPTWSITVGPRGIGLKKLWRHRFIPHDDLREVRLDKGTENPRLRFVTNSGLVGVFPRIPDGTAIARHIESLQRSRS